jgi:hypothetical protein
MTRPHLVGKNGIDGAALSLVAQICETWGDTRDRNFTVARLLLELKPTKKHWDKYSLPFCYSWGKRLIKIAKDRRIAENYDEMPEARTGLYEVALLIDKYFYAALREKIINPSASAQDIRELATIQTRRAGGGLCEHHASVPLYRSGAPDAESNNGRDQSDRAQEQPSKSARCRPPRQNYQLSSGR